MKTRAEIVAAVLSAADAEWRLDVRDDRHDARSLKRIDGYIRSPHGLGWESSEPYQPGPHQFEWCGAFASWSLRAAGWHPALALHCGSSTRRLFAYGQYRVCTAGSKAVQRVSVTPAAVAVCPGLAPLLGRTVPAQEAHDAAGGRRLCQLVEPDAGPADLAWLPEPGDIVLVGPLRGRKGGTPLPMGRHVAICRAALGGEGGATVPTVEGNGRGQGPNGDVREGVVRALRPFGSVADGPFAYRVRALIRPALLDFVLDVLYA